MYAIRSYYAAAWGYDGKGQVRIEAEADAARAWAEVGGAALAARAAAPVGDVVLDAAPLPRTVGEPGAAVGRNNFV